MTKKLGGWLAALALCMPIAIMGAPGAHAQNGPYPFTVLSRVAEANPRVVALAIDFGRALPLNWTLARAFQVSAELKPVKTYAGDTIGNSAAARAPRTITAAYTSARPEPGSPSEGRYVIVEMARDDYNASSWYFGFNPGIRQMIPYGEAMRYEVRLLHDLDVLAAPVSPAVPGPTAETIRADASFRQAGARVLTAEGFAKGLYEMPQNASIRFLGYNLYKPADVPAGAKLPLVVFLHGSGQSHDYKAFANDPMADVASPLLANQGGVTWVENGREKVYVLVPQVPARDTRDSEGEFGWRSADTQALLLGLVDRVIAENPAIDTDRLYLTGLSLGAMGSWKLIGSADPKVSRKFAAAAVFAGVSRDVFTAPAGETPAAKHARILAALQAQDLSKVSVPVWIGHADTDPVVDRLGSRMPFAALSGQAQVDASGNLLPAPGVLKYEDDLIRVYRATNRHSGAELVYKELKFGNGDRFLDLGMVTRHGHFSWETFYKDPEMLDWMFRQVRKPGR
jgi:predicted peptidase